MITMTMTRTAITWRLAWMIIIMMMTMIRTRTMITWRRALHRAGDQPALHQTAAADKYVYKYESRHSK